MTRPTGMRVSKTGEGDREWGCCDPGGELRHSVTGELYRVQVVDNGLCDWQAVRDYVLNYNNF